GGAAHHDARLVRVVAGEDGARGAGGRAVRVRRALDEVLLLDVAARGELVVAREEDVVVRGVAGDGCRGDGACDGGVRDLRGRGEGQGARKRGSQDFHRVPSTWSRTACRDRESMRRAYVSGRVSARLSA